MYTYRDGCGRRKERRKSRKEGQLKYSRNRFNEHRGESQLRTAVSQLRANYWGKVECVISVNRAATKSPRRTESFHTDTKHGRNQTAHLDDDGVVEEMKVEYTATTSQLVHN